MRTTYDQIGRHYSRTRQADSRIAERIIQALGDSRSVVNVGAGTGSYEPRDRRVIAVEPSATMIGQRPAEAAAAIQGAAECLPLVDGSVDAALAILTIHHWSNPACGLAEMRRVAARRVVILTWDQSVWESFWLIRDYLPCAAEIDRVRAVAMVTIVSALGPCQISALAIPHDCIDGFHGAFWRRPEAYLDPRIRSGISTFASLPDAALDEGLGRLAGDLQSGAWRDRYDTLLDHDQLDLGYRLIVAQRR